MGAGKRLLTGESLFMTVFTHSGAYGRKSVTFAAPYPGKIIPLDLQQYGGEVICQKDSFLCAAAKVVSIGIEFQRKLGAGFFGGEVLFFVTLRGPGKVWVQSLPFSRMAERILSAAGNSGRKEEGSALSGMGNLLDGR